MTATMPCRPPGDAALPVLDRLTDRRQLAKLFEGLPWLDRPSIGQAEFRLRWKPGTNVRIGAVLLTAAGPVAVLVAAFAPGSGRKTERIADLAARRGVPAHVEEALVVVPARADPDIGAWLPDGEPLAYNPARRWVGLADGCAIKIHAHPLPLGVTALLSQPPAPAVRHLPPAPVLTNGGRMVRSAWVSGRAPTPATLPAVQEALAALHASPPPAGLPELDAAWALGAVRRAVRSVASALPAQRARLAALVAALAGVCAAGAWPGGRCLVHGDFSPDQVVVTEGRAVLLDLDRAAVGPTGWDAAQWSVAQHAPDVPVLSPPGSPAPPVLTLAAALVRAPEPFRRLHPDWVARTDAILDVADGAAGELSWTG